MKLLMYQFLEHTADLKVKACGNTFVKALEECANAMLHAQLSEIKELIKTKQELSLTFKVKEENWQDLVVSTLEEILFIEETKKIQGIKTKLKGNENSVIGILRAYIHPPSSLIKAITYHELNRWVENGNTCITVVFDI